jgi:putative toxin-antitoxin system antitoxin component (TIGR02293 family)
MSNVYKVADMLGSYEVFRTPLKSEMQLFDEVQQGLPPAALDQMVKHHLLSLEEMNHLVVSPRTLARRRKEKHLSPEESDRLARLARIMAYAEEVFGDREKAHTWLRRPNRAMEGRLPLDLLETETGGRIVETILGRIQHGIYS